MSTYTTPQHARRSGNHVAVAAIALWAVIAVVFGFAASANAATQSGGRVPVSCATQLKVIRHVSRESGITIGSTNTSVHNDGRVRLWARELGSVGLTELARLVRAMHDKATDHDYVVAMTATALAYITGHCGTHVAIPAPGWLHYARRSHTNHGSPCVVVWGGRAPTGALICENGKAYLA